MTFQWDFGGGGILSTAALHNKPYMVHFPFSPSAERLKLESDLNFIQNHITNAHQFALLDKRALRLFKMRWARKGYAIVDLVLASIDLLSFNPILRGPRGEDIITVISEVRENVEKIPPGSSSDPSIDDHQKFCEILREGIANLNSLTVPLHY
jgi:hypothetical protein